MNQIFELVNDPCSYGGPTPQILDIVRWRVPAGQSKIIDVMGGYSAIPFS